MNQKVEFKGGKSLMGNLAHVRSSMSLTPSLAKTSAAALIKVPTASMAVSGT